MSWLRRGRAQEGAYFRQEADFAAAKLRRELKEKGLLVEDTPARKAAWEEGASEVLPEILSVSQRCYVSLNLCVYQSPRDAQETGDSSGSGGA